mgnify:CR=1 FL=1
MKQRDLIYEPPMIEAIEVEVESGIATTGSFEGYGPDSDDSAFG